MKEQIAELRDVKAENTQEGVESDASILTDEASVPKRGPRVHVMEWTDEEDDEDETDISVLLDCPSRPITQPIDLDSHEQMHTSEIKTVITVDSEPETSSDDTPEDPTQITLRSVLQKRKRHSEYNPIPSSQSESVSS